MTAKQVICVGIILGVVAAAVVWYLERFEINRLHGEVMNYLNHQDGFKEFLREKGID